MPERSKDEPEPPPDNTVEGPYPRENPNRRDPGDKEFPERTIPPPPSREPPRAIELKKGVVIPSPIKGRIDAISTAYRDAKHRGLLITDGYRHILDQAKAMRDGFDAGDDGKIYTNKALLDLIKAEYISHKDNRGEQLLAMAAEIERQFKAELYISYHPLGYAFDVSAHSTDIKLLTALVHKYGGRVTGHGAVFHYHIEFDPPRPFSPKMLKTAPRKEPDTIGITCSPPTFSAKETVTIEFGRPHGLDLAIIRPDDSSVILSFHQPFDSKLQPIIDRASFSTKGAWRIKVATLLGYDLSNKPARKEKVFTVPGTYTLLVGNYLESDGPPSDGVGFLHFSG